MSGHQSPYPDELPGHAKDCETSIEAAKDIMKDANRLQKTVYGYIKSRGGNGATTNEIMEWTKRIKDSIAPRVTELKDRFRVIKDSGKRRLTPSGKRAKVWVVNDNPNQIEMF